MVFIGLGIEVESPQGGTTEDLEWKARPVGEPPNEYLQKKEKPLQIDGMALYILYLLLFTN
ncbi:hypothetical protein BZG01_16550 [Labilibaculum manganireducens]|uniref:Uncharacterized protein n=1 Tax=Labilibaculum manganireducens TaxID=1940525 RepID=A0A2N3HY60_9BACT|nr:hypothetical protein BZG01_16550 [Labilibaculum manganireducens]